MNKKIFNLDQLISVEVIDRKKCTSLVYQPFKKKKFWKDQKEGYYYDGVLEHDFFTKEDIIDGVYEGITDFLFEDNAFYYRPLLILWCLEINF